MKRTICFITLCCLILSYVCVPIAAVESGSYSLNWTNISSITGTLAFNGTTGNYSMVIEGKSGTELITATATLYYQNAYGNWIEIPKNWEYSVNSDILFIDEDFSAVSNLTYKVVLETTVYVDGVEETVTKTTTKTN